MKRNEIIYKTITHPFFVFPLLIILLIAGNGAVPLTDQDEGAYALISAQMAETGDYINQDATWSEIHRKPPLHFWLIAKSIQIFGQDEWVIRLSTVFFAWLTLLIIYLYGRNIYHERIALTGTIITATCFLFPIYGKLAFTDGTLLFFQTWAAFSLMSLMQSGKIKHAITFWIAFGLGALVKGPPIIIFTGIFGLLLLLFHYQRKTLIRLHPWFFLPLALAPILYWGYEYWQRDGGKTITWMLDWYVFKRAKGEAVIHNQKGYPGTYFLMFAFAFMPYFRYFLPAVWEGIKGLFLRRKNPEFLMLAIWLVAGWWIYELIPSKLPSYVLASVPAIALLMAHEMISLSDKKIFSTGLKALSVIEILINCGLVALVYFFGRDYADEELVALLSLIFLFLPLASITSFIQQLRKHFTLSIYFHLIFVGVFWLMLAIVAYPKIGTYWDGYRTTAQHIQDNNDDSSKEVHLERLKGTPPSLVYYLKYFADKNVSLSSSWFETMQKYEKSENFIAVVPPTSKDTIATFHEIDFKHQTLIQIDSGNNDLIGFYIFNKKKK